MATLTGSTGNDTLIGNNEADTIQGLEGNDILDGQDNNDTIEGGTGDDTVTGGNGNDILSGGSGVDTIDGGAGDDTINGPGPGVPETTLDDIITGGDGNDTITGYGSVDGGAGNDTISGSGTLIGGDGNDIVSISGSSTVDLGIGADRVSVRTTPYFPGNVSTIDLGVDAVTDTIELSADMMVFPGQSTAAARVTVTNFTAGLGGDMLDVSRFLGGFDPMSLLQGWDGSTNPFSTGAGGGFFRLVADGADTLFEVDRDGGGDGFVGVVRFVGVAPTAFVTANFSPSLDPTGAAAPGVNLVGTPGSDTLTGTSSDDTLTGLGGSDTLTGSGGSDTIDGGDGIDTLNGGAGDDIINGGNGNDIIYAGNGADTINGGAGDDTINGPGPGVPETTLDDIITGGDGNDTITGYGSVDGGTGNDIITGAGTLTGGDGNDTVSISGSSTVDLGIGADRVSVRTTPYFPGNVSTIDLGVDAVTDTIELSADMMVFPGQSTAAARVTVTNFTAGLGGDVLDVSRFLGGFDPMSLLQGWDGSTNPFSTGAGGGFFRLVADGADTLFEVDRDGGGGGDGFVGVVRFVGVAPTAFVTANFSPSLDPTGAAAPGVNLVGTPGSDTLTGTSSDDTLTGLGGSDTLTGSGGSDTIDGGDGIDTLNGGAGDDIINGGNGNDIIYAGNGADTINGGAGDDTINGPGPGVPETTLDDIITGGDGNDTITGYGSVDGGAGNDTISGSGTLIGGDGNDIVSISGSSTVDLGIGADRVSVRTTPYFPGNVSTIDLGVDAVTDTIELSADMMVFPGQSTAAARVTVTNFTAGLGGDVLDVSRFLGGFDPMSLLQGWDGSTNPFSTGAGGGFFRLVADGADTLFEVDRDGGGDGFIGVVRFVGVAPTAFVGTNFKSPYIPTGEPSAGLYVVAEPGVPVTLINNLNNVVVAGNTPTTVSITGTGSNLITLGSGGNFVVAGSGSDTVVSGDGNDTIYGDEAPGAPANGAAGFVGGAAAVSQDDQISGGGGNDTLIGGAGNDTMNGGNGDDIYSVDATGDVVTEASGAGSGSDTVFASATFTLTINVETLILVGNAAISGAGNDVGNNLIGNAQPNMLFGNGGGDGLTGAGGSDTLIGGLGNDGMAGGVGDDLYSVDSIFDVIAETAGEGLDTVFSETNHVLYLNVESLILVGIGNTQAYGNAQQNFLYGNAGNNYFDSAGQADYMHGGGGSDVYRMRLGELNGDLLGDFASGDLLQFQGYNAATTTVTQLNSFQYRVQDSASGANEVFGIVSNYTLTAADYTFV